jgi:hypothetical protein
MENIRQEIMKSTMTYGAILGVVIGMYSLVLFTFNIMPIGFIQIALAILIIITYCIGIYLSTKKIRNIVFKGNLTYRLGLLIGTLVTLFAAIISEFYIYIQNTLLEPDYMTRFMIAQIAWLKSLHEKIPDIRIENLIHDINEAIKYYDSLSAFFQSISSITIFGFAFSLIISAFLKKETSHFEDGQFTQT